MVASAFIEPPNPNSQIRGHRAEIAEIEVVICRHPAVMQAIVAAVSDEEIGNRLRAVIVPKGGARADAKITQRALRRATTAVHDSGDVSFLFEFAVKSNGKIDRQALLRLA